MITQCDLKERFNYDPETGVFTYRKTVGNRKTGHIAGCVHNNGYLYIKVNSKKYHAARLAYLYVFKKFPKGDIDHINGKKLDNRIVNLRDVSHRKNTQNRSEHRNGKLTGATLIKNLNKWKAQCRLNGKRYYLGLFETEEEAHRAYAEAIQGRDADNG